MFEEEEKMANVKIYSYTFIPTAWEELYQYQC